jgi:hypothetical protein
MFKSLPKGLLTLCVGVVLGVLAVAPMLVAQTPKGNRAAAKGWDGEPFEIVDTPSSTYLLNKKTGEVWRLSFTEIKGDRFWFGTYVPVEKPVTFETFQDRLRRRLKGASGN